MFWLNFLFEMYFLTVSKRKNSSIFPCEPFFFSCGFEEVFIEVP